MIRARARKGTIAVTVALATSLQVLAGWAVAGPGPPPTPVPPDGSLSPFPQTLQTPAVATILPSPDAAAASLTDLGEGQVMYAKAPQTRRPIASLTKIMTALLVLEAAELDHVVTVASDAVFGNDDYGASSTLGLRAGERRTVRELLYAIMLGSANDAALALAIEVSGSVRAFVEAMNRRAKRLGMADTVFFSPHGLDDRGRSTPADLTRLVDVAFDTPGFAPIVRAKTRTIGAPPGMKPRKIQNRNAMLWLYPGTVGVKTGSTAGAGSCLVAVAERQGRPLVAVLLGSSSSSRSFSEAATMLDYGFEAFERHAFVTAGASLGTVAIEGGVVSVQAGEGLDALAPVDAIGRADERIMVSGDAVFPPAAGERVGTLKVTIAGLAVGTVPVVVAQVPAPPPAGGGPWWARAGGAVVNGVGEVLGGLLG